MKIYEITNNSFHIVGSDAVAIQISYATESTNY